MRVKRNCLQCQKPFHTSKQELDRGNGKFCSLSCSSRYAGAQRARNRQPNVTCAYCGKPFYKTPSSMRCSRSGLFFCCRQHKDQAQRIGGLKQIMPAHYGASGTVRTHRKRVLATRDNSCNRCGWNDYPAILHVHHRDRDKRNNKDENLEILCPTCHEVDHFLAGDGRWSSPS